MDTMHEWETENSRITDTKEERRVYIVLVSQVNHNETLHRFSSFSRLIRVTTCCLRWLRGANRTDDLSTEELRRSALRWFSIVQQQDFAEEHTFTRGLQVSPSSRLSALRPSIGRWTDQGWWMICERVTIILRETSDPVDEGMSLITLARRTHWHGGPRLTRSVLARHYWILQANSLIRSEIKHCVRCAKSAGVTAQQQMGYLSKDRVQAARPFWSSGVDFAGPIQICALKGRGHKSYKAHICLFICIATKAVHLKAVSDLSTNAFIAALERFVARRGLCAYLRSDNRTNFNPSLGLQPRGAD